MNPESLEQSLIAYPKQTLIQHLENQHTYQQVFKTLALKMKEENRNGEAFHFLKVACELDIENQETRELMKKVVLERSDVSLGDILLLDEFVEEFSISLTIARGFLRNKDFGNCWKYLLKASRQAIGETERFEVYFEIGNYFYQQSNHKNALIYFKKCRELREDYKVLNMIACIYIYNGIVKKPLNY